MNCFNPLDRGNLYQIFLIEIVLLFKILSKSFNPLDRGNLYQMDMSNALDISVS